MSLEQQGDTTETSRVASPATWLLELAGCLYFLPIAIASLIVAVVGLVGLIAIWWTVLSMLAEHFLS